MLFRIYFLLCHSTTDSNPWHRLSRLLWMRGFLLCSPGPVPPTFFPPLGTGQSSLVNVSERDPLLPRLAQISEFLFYPQFLIIDRNPNFDHTLGPFPKRQNFLP